LPPQNHAYRPILFVLYIVLSFILLYTLIQLNKHLYRQTLWAVRRGFVVATLTQRSSLLILSPHLTLKTKQTVNINFRPLNAYIKHSVCLHTFERKNFIHGVAHFTKSATILANSRNGQTQCPFHELGNALAHFVKWAISQIGRNIYVYLTSTMHLSEPHST